MQFQHPIAFFLLRLIPILLIAAILTARARGKHWKKLVSSRLHHALVKDRSSAPRWVAFGLGLLAFLFLVTTLTVPHAGYHEEKEIVRGRNILLAIDVSRSMLAKDESPNRLTAARAAALEVLDLFPNDRIGLIAFSGAPWLHAPLTIDHSALTETLQQLDAETLPRGGSDLSQAVELTIETFKKTGQPDNALIIFSDGEAHDGDVEKAAEKANEEGLTIYTIGFGSEEGDFIPDPKQKDKRVRDRSGNLVFTRLKSEDLHLLATRTGGFYTQGSGKQLSRSLRVAVDRIDQSESEGGERKIINHRFQWFLLPAMILLIASLLSNVSWSLLFRKVTPAALLFMLLPTSTEARVLPATSAEKSLEKEDYEKAYGQFNEEASKSSGERRARLKLGEGAAAYQSGKFKRALESYSSALLSEDPGIQTEAHFGLGNSLYNLSAAQLKGGDQNQMENAIKRLEDALSHFDQTLSLSGNHAQAQANRDHVAKVIEMLQQQQNQEQQQQDQQNQEQNQEQNQDQQEQNQRENGENSDQNQDQNEQSSPQDSPPEPNQDEGGEGQEQESQPGDQGDQEQENGQQNEGENSPQDQPQPGEDSPPQPEPSDSANSQNQQTAGNQQQNPQPAQPQDSTNETPEERASRILAENADFQTAPLIQKHLQQPRTKKDW